jgi:predicted dehydrogenase
MLKVGVLGAGHLGKIHLKLLKEIDILSISGFYDPDRKKAEETAREFNITSFETEDDLIKHSDIVDIVTPTLFHYELALKALKNSKHLFIEKPVTTTIAQAKELISLAREANVKVQVGHVERFNPAFLAARPYIHQPMFIESHRLALFNPRGTDVSVVLDLMIHDIDIILSTVKSSVKRVSASGVAVLSDTPDIANARIEFANGCVANLTASRISLKNMRKTRFFQRDAYLSIDFLEKKTEVVKIKKAETENDPLSMIIDLGEKGKKIIYYENPKVEVINAIKMELQLLGEAILNNEDPPVTLQQGHDALFVAQQVIDKLKIMSPMPVV